MKMIGFFEETRKNIIRKAGIQDGYFLPSIMRLYLNPITNGRKKIFYE